MLSECHVMNNIIKPFIIKASPTYTYHRALEELHDADDEKDYKKKDECLIRAIQLINITRYKFKELYGPIQTKDDQGIGTGSKDTSKLDGTIEGNALGSDSDTR